VALSESVPVRFGPELHRGAFCTRLRTDVLAFRPYWHSASNLEVPPAFPQHWCGQLPAGESMQPAVAEHFSESVRALVGAR
jgi:hypothetical protein